MLFYIQYTDKPDALPIREKYYDQHVTWLKAHGDVILVAGVHRETPEARPKGAVWIVNAPDRAALTTLIDTDPFWEQGLRATRDISYFSAALPTAWPKA